MIKKHILPIFLAIAPSAVIPMAATGASFDELERKIEQLSEELNEVRQSQSDDAIDAQDEIETTNERLDYLTKISGYADVEYRDTNQSGTGPGFRLHHLSLFVTKRFNDKWRFFSEIEYEDAPKYEATSPSNIKAANGKIFVEAVNVDYLWRPEAIFRLGRFFTPAGIWSIDHYPPFVPTQERPLHIRKIFPQLVDGADVYGSVRLGNSFVNYDLYTGNGEGNTGRNDENSDKAVGTKLSLVLPMLKYLELGTTAYYDTLNNDDEKTALGVHAKVQQGSFTFQGEYAYAKIEQDAGGNYHDQGYYGQFLYDWRRLTAGYRYDTKNIGAGSDRGQLRNSVFINYHATANIVFKLEHHKDDFSDSTKDNVTTTIASLAVFLD